MTAKKRRLTWIAATIPELSAAIGVSERQIGTYIGRGMPREMEGFRIPDCIGWLRENVWRARPVQVSGDMEERMQRAELKKAEAQAGLAELRRRKMDGELMETAETIALMSTMAALVRSRLQAGVGEMAGSFPL